MATTLRLQDLDLEIEAPSDLYRSTNSAYACILASRLSVLCAV